jgi:CheY-like chemotaxis protein
VSAQQLHNTRQKVLVVDDDSSFRELLTELLETAGCCVWTAQDGLAGLDALHNGPFDLILVDYRMPRMTGLDMSAFIRRTDTVTPIILITGDYYTLDPEIVAQAGITQVLPKPLKIQEFLNICSTEGTKNRANDNLIARQKEAA